MISSSSASNINGRPLAAARSRTKPRRPTIHDLLPRVMRDVGEIGRRAARPPEMYRFRSLDDALNAIHPVLVRHRVSVSFHCHDHRVVGTRAADARGRTRTVFRATLLLELNFWAPDGSCVSNTAAGEGQDEAGDRATSKAMASALKYGLLFGLLAPVGQTQPVETQVAAETRTERAA